MGQSLTRLLPNAFTTNHVLPTGRRQEDQASSSVEPAAYFHPIDPDRLSLGGSGSHHHHHHHHEVQQSQSQIQMVAMSHSHRPQQRRHQLHLRSRGVGGGGSQHLQQQQQQQQYEFISSAMAQNPSRTATAHHPHHHHHVSTPSSGQSPFFGPHFLMGGERYDVAPAPHSAGGGSAAIAAAAVPRTASAGASAATAGMVDSFLFGDLSDLELLCMTKPAKPPLNANRGLVASDSVGILYAAVNIRRDSVKFVRVGGGGTSGGGGGETSGPSTGSTYRLEFLFDSDLPCYVQLHFCAKEMITTATSGSGAQSAGAHVEFVSRYPGLEPSERFHYERGAAQLFNKYTFKPQRYDLKALRYEGGPHFPLVIEIRTVPPSPLDNSSSTTKISSTGYQRDLHPHHHHYSYYSEQVQSTLCSIEQSAADTALPTLVLKPLKQKLIVNGVCYLLQELFGLENKEQREQLEDDNGDPSSSASALDMDSGGIVGECIICMAEPRDTVILPCRHCCICNACAETLRYKLTSCPICRAPFRALLKLKTLRSVPMPTGTAGTVRVRQEAVPLMEALNGPCPVTDITTTTATPAANFATSISSGGGVSGEEIEVEAGGSGQAPRWKEVASERMSTTTTTSSSSKRHKATAGGGRLKEVGGLEGGGNRQQSVVVEELELSESIKASFSGGECGRESGSAARRKRKSEEGGVGYAAAVGCDGETVVGATNNNGRRNDSRSSAYQQHAQLKTNALAGTMLAKSRDDGDGGDNKNDDGSHMA